jgi:prolyl oligopeptidase
MRALAIVALGCLAACAAPPVLGPPPAPPPPTSAPATKPMNDPAPHVAALPYPATRTVDVADTLHGTKVPDPYRWLEDAKSPEVQAWMTVEDALARAELAKLPERDAIAARLKQLFYVDSVSAPTHRGSRHFYVRRHATKEKAVVYVKDLKTGAEEVLLDPNTWSEDGSLALGVWRPSWDGTKVAYAVRQNASDESTLYVLDVATRKKSAVDVIEGAKYADPSWTPKGDGFYYTSLPKHGTVPDSERPGFAEVRFHKLGTEPSKDALVHEKTGDPTRFISADLSQDGRFLVLSVSHGWTSIDVWFRDLKKGATSPWVPLAVGQPAHYAVDEHAGLLYVHTDEGAPLWRLFRVDPAHPERAAWNEIVAERKDAKLDAVGVLGGKLALRYLKDATGRLEVRSLDGSLVREVPLPGVGSIGGPYGRADEDEAYFSFESFTTPNEIHATSIATGKTSLYAKVEVPIDASPYLVEEVFFPSKDGTRVSMFIVRRKDMKRDGSTRLMLRGYGGFLVSETPSFVASIYPWLERGGAYAVANLRGGGEYGEAWHKDGMLLRKQNVFDDFIAASEYLVKEGYTRPSKLAITGGSNGGLLMGAAITQRPDLFGAVLCAVPLLDMVRYHLFGSGKTWISEYGSADDADQFRALFAYSPYHHVKAGTRYPSVLMLSADSDDRVDPLHARKFAAALQAASTGGPVLLRIEKHAGHGGADLVKAEVEKGADRYAFALAHTAAD